MKILFLIPFSLFLATTLYAAPDLTATVSVEKSSDTGAAAKTAALTSARSQIFMTVASRYANAEALKKITPSDAAIQNIISSTSIDDEKTGAADYSADVTISFDKAQLEKWFSENGLPNYLSAADSTGDQTMVVFYIGGLRDWVDLTGALQADGMTPDSLNMSVKSILGRQANASISSSKRAEFTSALRKGGWTVTDKGGYLQVSRQ
ncbi:hypothetical protein FACS189421_02920 [Bacteroidia bacterium]|nr:hypothetical protein FACS189421_02920 [Bacteroidia bacterium]